MSTYSDKIIKKLAKLQPKADAINEEVLKLKRDLIEELVIHDQVFIFNYDTGKTFEPRAGQINVSINGPSIQITISEEENDD